MTLAQERFLARAAVPVDDRAAFAWLRYYGRYVLLVTIIGVAIGGGVAVARPASTEAWTYLLQTPYRIPRGQLALMSKALFSSPLTYTQAQSGLGGSVSRDAFYANASVLPVPQTNTIIVIGRGRTPAQAEAVSTAAAQGLLTSFDRAGFTEFQNLGTGPAATSTTVSSTVLVAAIGFLALLLGTGTALLHYGLAHPVLTLERAVAMTGPSRVVVADRRSARDGPTGSDGDGDRHGDGHGDGRGDRSVGVQAYGGRRVRRTAERFDGGAARGAADGHPVLVVGPWTREIHLLAARVGARADAAGPTLVWVP